jgi:hypothetical protein
MSSHKNNQLDQIFDNAFSRVKKRRQAEPSNEEIKHFIENFKNLEAVKEKERKYNIRRAYDLSQHPDMFNLVESEFDRILIPKSLKRRKGIKPESVEFPNDFTLIRGEYLKPCEYHDGQLILSYSLEGGDGISFRIDFDGREDGSYRVNTSFEID